MRRFKNFFLVVFFSFLGGFSGQVSAKESNLVYGEAGRLDTFDPFTTHEASGQRLADLIFDGLVSIDSSGRYLPGLATSWKISGSRTSIDFNLRKQVYWHGSKEEFDADDVLTTVRLLKSAESEIPNKERFEVIGSVKKINSHKIRVQLQRALLDPLRVLAFKIIPHHVLTADKSLKRGSAFARHPIGTGPYAFVRASDHGEVLLRANTKYFAKKAKIKQIVLKTFSDQSIMAQSLMFNSLDLITYVSPRDLSEVIGDRKLSVIPYDALSFTFFAMNTGRGILKDTRIRQGISHAVNRSEMLQAFFRGKGQLISGPFPPTSWAYNLNVKGLDYSPEKSRMLFSQAGLKDLDNDGFLETSDAKPVKLVFTVPLAGESEMVKRMVLAFQNYLKQVGLKVELQFMDWLVWKNQVIGKRDYDLTIASWSFDDASNITSLFHSSSAQPWGNNFVNFKNDEVDSLLTEADATNDFEKKRAIYHKVHAILAKEVPYTYLWTLMHHAAHSSKLSSVRIEPFSFFKYVSTWGVR